MFQIVKFPFVIVATLLMVFPVMPGAGQIIEGGPRREAKKDSKLARKMLKRSVSTTEVDGYDDDGNRMRRMMHYAPGGLRGRMLPAMNREYGPSESFHSDKPKDRRSTFWENDLPDRSRGARRGRRNGVSYVEEGGYSGGYSDSCDGGTDNRIVR